MQGCYWQTITTLFKKASEYDSYVVIQIDDDFFLCDKFIDRLIDKFFEGKKEDNKNVAIHYHLPLSAGKRSYWGTSNGVDGGALFDVNFLSEINHTIESISMRRWKLNAELSSGVWKQISNKIHYNSLLTYKLEHSLVEHDGNEDSKMNTTQRDRSPILTEKFKK